MSVIAGLIKDKIGGRFKLDGKPIYVESLKATIPSTDSSLPARPAVITIKYHAASLHNTPSSLLRNGMVNECDFVFAQVLCDFKDKAPQALVKEAESNPARLGGVFGTLSGLVDRYYGHTFLEVAAERIREVVSLNKPSSPSTRFHARTWLSEEIDSYSPNYLEGTLRGHGYF